MAFPSLDAIEKRGQEHWGLADRFTRALLNLLAGAGRVCAHVVSDVREGVGEDIRCDGWIAGRDGRLVNVFTRWGALLQRVGCWKS